jgi:hypothetical protein
VRKDIDLNSIDQNYGVSFHTVSDSFNLCNRLHKKEKLNETAGIDSKNYFSMKALKLRHRRESENPRHHEVNFLTTSISTVRNKSLLHKNGLH